MEIHKSNDIKQEWTNIYGKITIFNYMVYGNIGERDLSVISHAIKKSFGLKKFIPMLEHINFEMAELFNLYQGTHIQWVFPDEIKETKENFTGQMSEMTASINEVKTDTAEIKGMINSLLNR